jgi:uncharacterized membrane protein YkoI
MRTKAWMLGVLGGLLVVGCTRTREIRDDSKQRGDLSLTHAVADDDDDGEEDGDVNLALSDVPDSVKQAALAAVPGLVLTFAERETEDGGVVYSLAGTANGKSYEVEVNEAGQVVEIEEGDDEDDEDDD